ncbi:GNAT family N-acetyltransferase [Bifidobacterium sp. 82T24]|uniref:GNAT family N-acetyltransferase n=1 Tax=Bifidobacterium pluvialisilvae TaxID=2834436 RepID=UPI001C5A1764|nr:GNAT family N-acetyltransferase [Bifidobacterium pluvialisilvae]MBW3087332.1 GNAT family N-acetyltransferase [Bifidobacterium pluvialisilvae]
MTSQAVLRAMRAEDMPAIEDLATRTWKYDERMTPRNAGLLGRIDACNCLSRRTFMRVADIDGQVAGLIVAADRRHPRTDHRLVLRQAAAGLRLLADAEGRRGLRTFAEYMATDRALDRDARGQGRRYDGEIVLFIVDDHYRGHGLGRLLFDAALAYFRDRGIDDVFLYTDTGCDYGFYDHRGMERRCSRRVDLDQAGGDAVEEMYIYDGSVGRLTAWTNGGGRHRDRIA